MPRSWNFTFIQGGLNLVHLLGRAPISSRSNSVHNLSDLFAFRSDFGPRCCFVPSEDVEMFPAAWMASRGWLTTPGLIFPATPPGVPLQNHPGAPQVLPGGVLRPVGPLPVRARPPLRLVVVRARPAGVGRQVPRQLPDRPRPRTPRCLMASGAVLRPWLRRRWRRGLRTLPSRARPRARNSAPNRGQAALDAFEAPPGQPPASWGPAGMTVPRSEALPPVHREGYTL